AASAGLPIRTPLPIEAAASRNLFSSREKLSMSSCWLRTQYLPKLVPMFPAPMIPIFIRLLLHVAEIHTHSNSARFSFGATADTLHRRNYALAACLPTHREGDSCRQPLLCAWTFFRLLREMQPTGSSLHD